MGDDKTSDGFANSQCQRGEEEEEEEVKEKRFPHRQRDPLRGSSFRLWRFKPARVKRLNVNEIQAATGRLQQTVSETGSSERNSSMKPHRRQPTGEDGRKSYKTLPHYTNLRKESYVQACTLVRFSRVGEDVAQTYGAC